MNAEERRAMRLFPCTSTLGKTTPKLVSGEERIVDTICDACGRKTLQVQIEGGEPECDYYECLECGEIMEDCPGEQVA